YLDLQFAAPTSDDAWSAYETTRADMERRGWLEWLGDLGERTSEDATWVGMNMRYDPLPALEHVKCPVLALFGERDRNVVPEENLPLMREALARAHNPDVTLVIVPGGDHGLRQPDQGPADAPMHMRTHIFAPEQW